MVMRGHSRFYHNFDVIVRSTAQREPDKRSFKWTLSVLPHDNEEGTFQLEVAKVSLFLHPSFRPHDKIELLGEPFEFTSTTYGEFPVRIRLHFEHKDMAPVDFYHYIRVLSILCYINSLIRVAL